MNRHIRGYDGRGWLDREKGGTQASYTLHEYQDFIPVATLDDPTASMPGLRTICGSISLASGSLPSVGNACTLQLQDDRKIKLLVESIGGRSAKVRASGGFF